ncbi:PEP-CTERM sorting domain-containing protein [Dechloromonas sp. A34]|uniref:PEP-CTERM sorting domain-containing protein n=1 Tax=Dechloromonas sp. A34 TaxID=447588 RepID=UPI002249396D|nr:PEP-CTERM sorting domain-containing protein [Dechloromonas sp. A34]
MKFLLLPLLTAVALSVFAPWAQAGTVTVTFAGTVSGYWSLPIVEDDFPIGTSVGMTLVYGDGFIGLPASQLYLGMSTTASGTLTLGSSSYMLNAMELTSYSFGSTLDDPAPIMSFHVTGTGPATDENEPFSGLMFSIFNSNPQGGAPLVGFGNVNWMVADNGYLFASGSSSYVQIENPIPEPSSLLLTLAGLALLRRRFPRT